MGTATRLVVFLVTFAALVGSPAVRAAEEVDLLLVLSSDVSRSIDAPKFKLQRDGYAAAIINPRVLQAIRSGALGKIAVSLVEWSGVGAQKIVIDWTVIRDEATAKDFSAQVIEAPRAFADRTSISGGIDFAMAQLARAPFQSNRHAIDVSGDGTNNSGRDVTDARDEALAKGVTINGLVILSERPMSWNADHTNPPGGLDAYYRNNVIGGPGSFVMVAENFSSFGQAILNKLIAEIASIEPAQHARAPRGSRGSVVRGCKSASTTTCVTNSQPPNLPACAKRWSRHTIKPVISAKIIGGTWT